VAATLNHKNKIENTDMQNLTQINSLVLVKLSSTAPSTSVLHKGATAKLVNANGTKKKAARVHATIVERKGSAVGRAAALVNTTQAAIRKHALPCPTIEGASYVQAKDVDAVQQIFDDAVAKLVTIRQDIVAEWPSLVAAARLDLGQLAYEVEWPTAEEFAARFTLSLTWLGQPAPIAGTLLESVTAETAARVRASSEQAVRNDLLAAHGHPVRELVATLAESVDQVRNGLRIRQERFDKIRTAADDIAAKNWLALPELDKLVESLRESVEGVTDASSLTKGQRADAADKIAEAHRKAEQTLADLGL
jgi:hypothetical protein